MSKLTAATAAIIVLAAFHQYYPDNGLYPIAVGASQIRSTPLLCLCHSGPGRRSRIFERRQTLALPPLKIQKKKMKQKETVWMLIA